MAESNDEVALITSTRNPLIKRVRELRRRETRIEAGMIVIEGLRAVIEAVRAHIVIASLLYAPDRLRSTLAHATLADVRAAGTVITPVDAEILDSLSERESSQGIIAIARRPEATAARIPTTGTPLVVAIFEPQDPGNVGTIMRTADGAGAAAVAAFGTKGVDLFDPKAIRSSMGSIFALPVIDLGATSMAVAALHSRGLTLIGTSDKGAVDLWDAPLRGPVAILMGNERAGLSDDALAACDVVARIPLVGHADSLNVAAAASIFLFEAVRQRQANRT